MGKCTRVPGLVGKPQSDPWEEAPPQCWGTSPLYLSKHAVFGLSGETEPTGCVRGEVCFKELAHLMMEGRPADWRLGQSSGSSLRADPRGESVFVLFRPSSDG